MPKGCAQKVRPMQAAEVVHVIARTPGTADLYMTESHYTSSMSRSCCISVKIIRLQSIEYGFVVIEASLYDCKLYRTRIG